MFQRSVDDASLQALLLMFGLSEQDYQFIPHNFSNWAVIEGTADVMSAYRSNQPFMYEERGVKINMLDPASYGIDFYGDLLFTTEERVKNDFVGVKRFVKATHKGWQYALENQHEIAELIVNKYKPDLNLQVLIKEARVIEQVIKPKLTPIGNVFPERFERIAQSYKALNMVPQESVIEGLLLQEYEPKPFHLDKRLIYVSCALLVLIICYVIFQVQFNVRLKRIVKAQTKTLAYNNEQLQQRNQQLVEQKQKVEEARAIAEEASAAKSLFLANMSHEIRTPMNGVLGTLQLLQQMPQPFEAEDLINKAAYSSKALLTIINDILDFSKIEAGKLSLENTPFNLDELIDSVYTSLLVTANEKDIEFIVRKGERYHNGWSGDAVRVRQILLNIASNALKFTQEGKVSILVEVNAKSALCFCVSDTGIGMSEDALLRLFNRFEQADNSTTRKFGGTGLGMAISKSLVEMMSGNIRVSSELGKGSTFNVSLPLTQVDLTTHNRQINSKAVPQLEAKTILLVEDNRINQTIFCSMMKETHVNLVIANNGQEAIDKMGLHPFDLVFMDIQMPVMDGVTACKIIKQLYPNTPIIALTANVMDKDIERYLASGFEKHIGKPIDLHEIYQCCNTYICTPTLGVVK